MGNEMGNNNVSGLQEEEKARTDEAQLEFLEVDVCADELKGENHTKPEAEDRDVQEKQDLNEKGEGKDFEEVVVPFENPLAVEEPQEEYKTSNGNEEHDIEFKPLSGPLEIPADVKDVEKDAMNHEKTDLDETLLTTAEQCTEKEIISARDYDETKNQIVDLKTELSEVDLNSDQHKVVHAEQVAEGIYTTESENGHLVHNDIIEDMCMRVEPENVDQTMATITNTLVLKAMVCEEEFKGPTCEGNAEVFSPDEVDKCSQDEHDGPKSPLGTVNPVLEAPESAEASDQQLQSFEKFEAPQDDLTAPLETLRAPLEALEPAVVIIEAPVETLESPLGVSDPQLALPLLVKASGSPLEVSNSLVEVSELPVKELQSPLVAAEPLMEESDSILESSELQLEAFAQPSFINTSQGVYEPQDNTIKVNEVIQRATEIQNGETKLAYNKEISSEDNNKIFETFQSKASQSEHISAGSDCNKNEKENALASNIEKDCLHIESEAQSQEPRVSFLSQTLEPCLQEQQQMKESLLLSAENISIGIKALESPLASAEGPLENLESPLGASEPQRLALPLLVQALDSTLEVSNSLLEVSEPQVETSESPSTTSEPPVEVSKSQVEASNSPSLKASEPSQKFLESQVEASKSPSKASELPLEASNSAHKAADTQLEALLHPHSVNSSEEVYEVIHISSEMQTRETKLSDNQPQPSEENEKKFEALKPMESQSEFEVQIDKPQLAILNQLHKPCLEKQQNIKESLLLAEQRNSIGSEVDREKSQCDHIQNQFCHQESEDDNIASQSAFVTTETDCTTNEKPSAHESNSINSTYSIEENCQLEDFEVNHITDEVSIADKNLKQEFSEVSGMMSDIKAVSHNDLPPYFHDSEVFKDKNELVSDSKSELIIIKEKFQANLSDAVTQSVVQTPEKESMQNIQDTSSMTESSTLLFDEQNAKDQETVEKLMTESSSDNASGLVEFRKSPSFHFDHSIGSRSEDSDHTPLLCHDKTAGRSLAMSQMDNLQAGFNAVRDEAVLVAEKTIRMERSDSERPSAPLLSLLQEEESAKLSVTPEKQKRVAADNKAKKNPWTVVHKTFALSSQRDNNGKHKPKSSIFSTCICCSTKNA